MDELARFLQETEDRTIMLDPDLARMAHANLAWGTRADCDALKRTLAAREIENERAAHPGLSAAAIGWLATGIQGTSSRTIFSVLTGIPLLLPSEYATPGDPADLRRCRLLLEQVPELQTQFPRMREVSASWARLVDAWDDLCQIVDDEAPDWRSGKGSAHRAYKRMKDLEDAREDFPKAPA